MHLRFARAFLHTHLLLPGRIHFPRQRIGELLKLPDGRSYRIFRQVIVDPGPGQPSLPGAIFIPHLHVRPMSPHANVWFSWLPVPLILRLPGFGSKLWLIHEPCGDFAGLYEWDISQDAEKYQHSLAMDFMTRRSEIVPREQWAAIAAKAQWSHSQVTANVGGSHAKLQMWP